MYDVVFKKTEFAILVKLFTIVSYLGVVVISFFNDFRRLQVILNFGLNYSNIFISSSLDQRREF